MALVLTGVAQVVRTTEPIKLLVRVVRVLARPEWEITVMWPLCMTTARLGKVCLIL